MKTESQELESNGAEEQEVVVSSDLSEEEEQCDQQSDEQSGDAPAELAQKNDEEEGDAVSSSEDSEEAQASGGEQSELPELDETLKGALVEALILAHGEPITLTKIKEVSGLSEADVRIALEDIEMRHSLDESGFGLVNANGRYQFRTKGVFAPYVQKLRAGRPKRLSPPALETLAIVAYRQPIVKSDVEKIRGVDATPTLKTLLEKGFIRIVGHRDSVGQPALYGTTEKFLNVFGLRALSELPTLRDLQELESDPGEVDYEDDDDLLEDSSEDEQQAASEAESSESSSASADVADDSAADKAANG